MKRVTLFIIAVVFDLATTKSCESECDVSLCSSHSLFTTGPPDSPLEALCEAQKPLRNLPSGPARVFTGNNWIKLSNYQPSGLKQKFTPHFFKVFTLYNGSSAIGHETIQSNQLDFMDSMCIEIPLGNSRCVFFVVQQENFIQPTITPTSVPTPSPSPNEPDSNSTIPSTVSNPYVNSETDYLPLYSENGYKFIKCSVNNIFIQVPKGITISPGTLISNELEEAKVCSNDCYPIFRKVESFDLAQSYEGESCPNGETCALIGTNKVQVIDIVTREFAQDPNFQNFIGQSFDIQEKCEAFKSLPEISRTVSDIELDTSSKVAFQGSCPEFWLKRSGENRQCSQSECSGDEDCFFCKDNCDNGCGSGTLGPVIPSSTIFWNFAPACCHHDHCYVTTRSRTECDLKFLGAMLAECAIRYENEILRKLCNLDAYVYYKAVDWLGEDAKRNAEEQQAKHEIDNCQADFILTVRPDIVSYDILVRNKPGNGMKVTVQGTDGFTAEYKDEDLDGIIDTPIIPEGASGVQDTVTAMDLSTSAVKTFLFTFS